MCLACWQHSLYCAWQPRHHVCLLFQDSSSLKNIFWDTNTSGLYTGFLFTLLRNLQSKEILTKQEIEGTYFEICFPDWAIQNLQNTHAISTSSSAVLLLLLFQGSYSGLGMAEMLQDRPQPSQQFSLKPSHSQPQMYQCGAQEKEEIWPYSGEDRLPGSWSMCRAQPRANRRQWKEPTDNSSFTGPNSKHFCSL